jgi:hypothetical protein
VYNIVYTCTFCNDTLPELIINHSSRDVPSL